jgi:ATP-dependent RNA helicase DDX46/PRP5
LEEQKRGKVLRPVDHTTIEYLPFRKNLYIVPKVIARLTDQQIEEKRELLQVKVRGKHCPSPVDTWGQCGLSERILDAIEKQGFAAPFAIQKQAIPAIMAGRDVIAVAKVNTLIL